MIRQILIALFSSAMFFAIPAHAQDTKVVLINVFEVPAEQEAEWATPQAFQAATKAMNESPTAKMPDSVKFTPGLFRVVSQ
jgi:hypothetical protein